MYDRITELLKEYCPGMEIKPEADLADDLKMMSMDIIEFIMDLEKEYKVRVPEKKLGKIHTVQDYVDLIQGLVSKK